MSNARATHPTRRGLLAAGGALGLGAALAACGDDKSGGSSDGGSAGGSGPWSFKDDRGTTVKLDEVPTSIVAFTGVAAALYDYGVRVKGVFGPTTTKDGKPDVQAGDMDVSAVTVLGNAWGQLNVEKYAALAPEVLITTTFDDAGTLWSVPEESKDKIAKLAPSVAVSVFDRQLTQPLQRMWELAGSLGADMKAAKTVQAKKDFEAAAERLRAAAKARPEIRVLAGSASADLFYVSGTDLSVDLEYFKALGVNFVEPPEAAKKATGGWFESLSWENVDKYPADVIIMDDRSSTIQPADITEGTWKKLPAVKAGQVIPRSPEPILSYAKCTPLLTNLAEAIEKAKKVG
ncbi:ABC transporter substrate-binding protein [Streptomyces griseoviridis]|jgi:iron complex transport system substrate-binding protein|uniref:Iron complex transport system substrate-binding protein n=3 Tax=Streptomyces TaxID=1883 RepID=A0ABT9LDZ4_STRGD|nr:MULTISPECIES: ABC transporter substrate-binding protein [Streptomyces]MDP9681941.1 iron complex transport system substrate-binding protein [Streptomyces griseoviridis]GGS17399.1 ABC transporter substrate-binding protein [Streptomyces niveoruber]GGT03716.1 ABC transporter substrate-binding protein [Streptomyces griseoviridis]GGU35869.1 ABC transporter substrate-binding protein [Streptomyces daghestanicus]GHI34073.1 ABC transporter substrate-binding protein [Streptomyces daghestanicus]